MAASSGLTKADKKVLLTERSWAERMVRHLVDEMERVKVATKAAYSVVSTGTSKGFYWVERLAVR